MQSVKEERFSREHPLQLASHLSALPVLRQQERAVQSTPRPSSKRIRTSFMFVEAGALHSGQLVLNCSTWRGKEEIFK